MDNKSLLDNLPVEDNAFPLNKSLRSMSPWTDGPGLGVVGHCPKCGNPIYSSFSVEKDEVPVAKRTCPCFPESPSMLTTKEK